MANAVTPEMDVSELIAMFEEAENATIDARQLSERDRDYYDGKQWTEEEKSKILKRGQPLVTMNAIQRKVDYLSGLERQTRRDPKAFPRTPKDEGAAQAATDALRYVCDDADWDEVRSAAWDNLMVEGSCAVMVGAKNGRNGVDPDLTHIRWDRFFADPHASRADYADAAYMGFITWDDLDHAKTLFPKKKDELDAAVAKYSNTDTYDDKPKWMQWADAKRRRIRYAEIYYRKAGVWHRCIFTDGAHLSDPEPSPYLDEDGQPENPIKAVCLRRDRENNAYGDVRIMISPQDELNKRHSKALHLQNMRQSRISHGAAVDADHVKRELAKPDGSITADKDEFEILPTNDIAAANLQMMGIAKAFIDGLGANAALAGKNEADMSGRAILAQQQGGMVELARAMDRLRVLSLNVYRSIWARIRQYWQGERWVRVTDDERNLRFVGLNKPLTVMELAQQIMAGDEGAMQTAVEAFGPQLGQMIQAAQQGDQQANMMLAMFVQQNGQQTVKVENAVAELDVDIVIDEGMDTPTVQAEQFDTLTKVLPALGTLPPPMMKMLIQASSLRDKDKMLEELDGMAQGPQVPPEIMEQMQAMQAALEELQAANAEKDAALKDKSGELQVKAAEVQVKEAAVKVDAYEAGTARLAAMRPQPGPDGG